EQGDEAAGLDVYASVFDLQTANSIVTANIVTRMEETRRKATQSVESGPDPTSLSLVSQPAIGLQKTNSEGLFRQADLKAAAPTLRTNRVVPLNYRLKPCGNGSSGAMT